MISNKDKCSFPPFKRASSLRSQFKWTMHNQCQPFSLKYRLKEEGVSRDIHRQAKLPDPGPWLSGLSVHPCHLGESFLLTKHKHHPDNVNQSLYNESSPGDCNVQSRISTSRLRRGKKKNGKVRGSEQADCLDTNTAVPTTWPVSTGCLREPTKAAPHPPNTTCRTAREPLLSPHCHYVVYNSCL